MSLRAGTRLGPYICALYDVGNQDGVGYLVMECLDWPAELKEPS
ncbi:MAG TPA: hypothetical protein VJ776_03175 [Thermoanaerobaculia bacterium]|nr:hypothetical protein [Thermoanaerobaculia bacterium]